VAAREGDDAKTRTVLLWDRKAEGGFPGTLVLNPSERASRAWADTAIHLSSTETKVLKQLVRDYIQPEKDLGHSDKHGKDGKMGKAVKGEEEKKKEVEVEVELGTEKTEEGSSERRKLEDCATCP